MLDSNQRLTELDKEEWGDPASSKSVYEYVLDYSPYDNLIPQRYPSLYITSGLRDHRVNFWEPTKYVARLRYVLGQFYGDLGSESKQDKSGYNTTEKAHNPQRRVLYQCGMESGHHGDFCGEAREFAFLSRELVR